MTARQCQFCMGEVPLEASKCMHCGEWLDQRPEGTHGADDTSMGSLTKQFFEGETLDETINAGVKAYAKWKIVSGVIGAVFALIVGLSMCSQMNESQRRFDDQFPGFRNETVVRPS